jgi:hypothetical protein
MLGGGVYFLGGLKDGVFECQAESSKIVRSEQPIQTDFGIFRKKVFKRPDRPSEKKKNPF